MKEEGRELMVVVVCKEIYTIKKNQENLIF